MSSNQSRLVFDIETIGEDFSKIDKTTQDNLTNWIKREAEDKDDYERMLDDLKNGLGFSPLTGEIVAIGVLDVDKNKGGVYYQSPDVKADKSINNNSDKYPVGKFEEDGITYEPMDEAGILKKFWDIASKYSVFATFNGRAFDVPFIMARSAIKKVKPTKNLMFSRYLYQQHSDSIHIDLCDQLSFQGAVRKKGSLHLWSRALGIKSPKASGITGDDVGFLFKKKKYLDIARYNVGDLKATKDLFKVWEEYFNI